MSMIADVGAVTGIISPPSATVPNAEDVGQQYTSLLSAFGQGLPQQVQLQNTYQPQLTASSLQTLDEQLAGRPASGTAPAIPGYLDIYQNLVAPSVSQTQTAANTALRTANVNDLANLGPGVTSALKGMGGGTSALMDALTKTASTQLGLGTQLDPNAVAQTNAAVNSNWANRGLGASDPAMTADALQLYAGGQNLLGQRESAAGSVAQEGYNLYTDPTLTILGMNSNASGQAQNLTATGNQPASATVMPTSDLETLFSGAYNTTANVSAENANSEAAMMGAGLSGMSQLSSSICGGAAGGMGGGGGGCGG